MTDRIRVLALSPMPEEGAGCRFRVAQYVPFLRDHGFDVTISPLLTTEFFRLVYQPGEYVRKAAGFARLAVRRLLTLPPADAYDLLLLYREVFPIGPAVVERFLTGPGRPPMVFDFDDAIFLPAVSEANRLIAALKQPSKVETIVRRADHVIAGNEFLASYARQYSRSVTIIPTCVDTARFVPRADRAATTVPTIGWIGSPTTSPYIAGLADVLRGLAVTNRFTVRISGAAAPMMIDGVHVENPPWSLPDEVRLFNTCDIGVYPLADDEWSRGKCGFKAIQFMACGVPVVASAVGVNREIIEDGVNGFLASTPAEWTTKLERLLHDEPLRRRIAAAGRRTVEERYSLDANGPRLAATLRRVVESARQATANAAAAEVHR